VEAGLHRPQTRVDVFTNLCSDEHQDGVCVYITVCVTAVLLCLWRLSHSVYHFLCLAQGQEVHTIVQSFNIY